MKTQSGKSNPWPFRALLLLCVLILYLALTGCKQNNLVTEDKLQHIIDSIKIANSIHDLEFKKFILDNRRIDTVMIINNKKTTNAVKKIDNLNNSQLNNNLDSVIRAEGLGNLPNK